MNTTLSTRPGRQQETQPQPVRRVGLVDQLALHVGLALITWGRRPRSGSSERRALKHERQLARAYEEHRIRRELQSMEYRTSEMQNRVR